MSIGASNSTKRFQVVETSFDTGERLPMLVDAETWLPARVATRWAVRYRRWHVASNTLAANLRVLKLVYEWAAEAGIDLDDRLLRVGRLEPRAIESLVAYLRSRRKVVDLSGVVDSGTLDRDIAVIHDFFTWAMDPANRGIDPSAQATLASLTDIAAARSHLKYLLDSFKTGAPPSRRRSPLAVEDTARIRRLVGPDRARNGSLHQPLVFGKSPWSESTRLRNWLMYAIAEQCGLRVGEILKLTLEDVQALSPGAPWVLKVVRRPDDPLDARRHPPSVKTSERVIEQSPEIRVAMRAYLTARPPTGRVAGKTPYLFVTESGSPLSYMAAYRALRVAGRHAGIPNLSWHQLRHTWAEALADELLSAAEVGAENGSNLQVIEKLRYLGGWSSTSSTPFHYIKDALAKAANRFLRERNERLYPTEGAP
jgi:integrase